MNARLNVIAVVAFLAALVGLLIYAGSPHNRLRLQAGFLDVITPFLKSGSQVERKYRDYRAGLKTLEQLETDVDRLRVSNKDLSATNQTLRGLEAENNRLRAALGYHERSVFKLTPAQIIGRSASTWYNTVTIDRGTEDSIQLEMPVITEEGLVGKTIAVDAHAAIVVLISDETCKVAASVEGSREQGIVRGERTSSGTMPEISLNFLSKQANLQRGQKVFSSGVGGVFPPGVLIGSILDFKARELDAYATIAPAVDLTTLQDVFVVVSNTK